MQPKSLLKETQQALANAIRLGNADPLNGYAANRLAVYTRLVRNNAFGFIDRCFVEAPLHIEPEYWKMLKKILCKMVMPILLISKILQENFSCFVKKKRYLIQIYWH